MGGNNHVGDLTAQAEGLKNQLSASSGDLSEFLKIILRPGWTTPAELALVKAMLTTAERQLAVLNGTLSQLKGAANLVGQQ